MGIEQLSTTNQITSPAHYVEGRIIEPLDVINSWELNYHLGNVLKYISRAGRKGCEKTDLEKALFYLDDFLRNCTEAKAGGYIKKEKCFSIENIAHDWGLEDSLKEAVYQLHMATYRPPTSCIESAKKNILERLKVLNKENEKVPANENSKTLWTGATC